MKFEVLFFMLIIVSKCCSEENRSVNVIDSNSPIIFNCPESFEVSTNPSQPYAFVSWAEPDANDDSGQVFRLFRSFFPNSLLPVGENEVIYVFSDASNNRAICQFTIHVKSVDTTPPTIKNCPNEITKTVEVGTEKVAVYWTEPNAEDDSGSVVLYERTNYPGELFEATKPEHLIRYTFIDTTGNVAYCGFKIKILQDDSVPPTITFCPSMITHEVDFGANGSYVDWMTPSAVDTSGSVTLVKATHKQGDFFPPGTTKVEYTFGDSSGNQAMCIIDIVISEVDRMVPRIFDCPEDIIVGVRPSTTTVSVNWNEPTATDNSGVAIMTKRTHSPGTTFDFGTLTEIMYQYSDRSGNTAYCSFDITVINDSQEPEIIGCPGRIIRQIERDRKGTTITWKDPEARDDISNTNIIFQSHESGSFFYIGRSKVEYVFQDAAKNTISCIFEVYVTEDETQIPLEEYPIDSDSGYILGIDIWMLAIPVTLTSILIIFAIAACYRKRINGTKLCTTSNRGSSQDPYYILHSENNSPDFRRNRKTGSQNRSKLLSPNGIYDPKGDGERWTDNWQYGKPFPRQNRLYCDAPKELASKREKRTSSNRKQILVTSLTTSDELENEESDEFNSDTDEDDIGEKFCYKDSNEQRNTKQYENSFVEIDDSLAHENEAYSKPRSPHQR